MLIKCKKKSKNHQNQQRNTLTIVQKYHIFKLFIWKMGEPHRRMLYPAIE